MNFPSRFRLATPMVPLGLSPPFIAGLDSGTTTVQATASFLQGKEDASGYLPNALIAPAVSLMSHIPNALREHIYTWSGWLDAVPPDWIDDFREEIISKWVVDQYPQRRYPAIMIGSANGAAVHLCAALGIPWLPQTLFMPVRRRVDSDNGKGDLEWGREPVQRLVEKNPHLRVYQHHDPNQDRLMLQRMAYFRLKRLRLGNIFEQFIEQSLAPGGTIFLLECAYTWPATRVSDSHIFQFGGAGGVTIEEYFEGGERVADYLRRRGADQRRWYPPEPNGNYPEAEWGFDVDLREDVVRFAREHKYRICRIVFDTPYDLSPMVADLYRWWYQQRGLPANRLLAESFVHLQPRLALQMGAVPFWCVFNGTHSADRLATYLDERKSFDEIHLTLFSNSTNAVGIAPIEKWQEILNRAQHKGEFFGVNENTYPRDLSSFLRRRLDAQKLKADLPLPDPLTLDQLDKFLAQADGQYDVRWLEQTLATEAATEAAIEAATEGEV